MSDDPYTVDPLLFENTFNYTIARFPGMLTNNNFPIINKEASIMQDDMPQIVQT
jgi:hypothetical protein